MPRCGRLAGAICLALALCLPAPAATQTGIKYVYDELGRLVAGTDGNGDSAVYSYDAVGNLLSIQRHAASDVRIFYFTPNSGPVGTAVTLEGSGFSSTPSGNLVYFNGTQAAVTSATADRLVVTVPGSATTGSITVTAPGGSAASSEPFAVVTSTAPSITGFSPSIGVAGTALTVTGTNFEASMPHDRVALNVTRAWPTAASSTAIDTSVPAGAGSGRISVATPSGSAVSTADFFVPPPPFGVTDVVYTNRMAIGDTLGVPVSPSGKVGLAIFDAAAGQRVSLKVVPGPSSDVKLFHARLTLLTARSTGIGTILPEPPARADCRHILDPRRPGRIRNRHVDPDALQRSARPDGNDPTHQRGDRPDTQPGYTRSERPVHVRRLGESTRQPEDRAGPRREGVLEGLRRLPGQRAQRARRDGWPAKSPRQPRHRRARPPAPVRRSRPREEGAVERLPAVHQDSHRREKGPVRPGLWTRTATKRTADSEARQRGPQEELLTWRHRARQRLEKPAGRRFPGRGFRRQGADELLAGRDDFEHPVRISLIGNRKLLHRTAAADKQSVPDHPPLSQRAVSDLRR